MRPPGQRSPAVDAVQARLLAILRGALYSDQAEPQICALHELTTRLLARDGDCPLPARSSIASD